MSAAAHEEERHAKAAERREPVGGARLREAREAAGLSIAQVSSRLHLDTRTIDALERADYPGLPAPTFVRGYLRAYARLLGLDPDPIVRDFDQCGLAPPELVPDIGDQSQARSGDLPVRMVTYVIVAGLAILVALWWQNREAGRTLPTIASGAGMPPAKVAPVTEPPPIVAPAEEPAPAVEGGSAVEQPAAPEAPEAPAATGEAMAAAAVPGPAAETAETGELGFDDTSDALPAGEAQGAAEGETAPAEAPAGTAAPAAEGTAQASQDVEPAGTAPAAAENRRAGADTVTAAETEAAQPEPLAPAADGSDRLRIGLQHESWVEVYDADGERLYYNLAHEGSEIAVSGRSPFRVLLGNARDVHVAYNGVAFDPTPFIARGIARFVLGGPHEPTGPGDLVASPPPATGETSE